MYRISINHQTGVQLQAVNVFSWLTKSYSSCYFILLIESMANYFLFDLLDFCMYKFKFYLKIFLNVKSYGQHI